jgi:hypothetical protein
MRPIFCVFLLTAFGVCAEPNLGPYAPQDKPAPVEEGKTAEVDRAIAPYVEDKTGKWEQTFVADLDQPPDAQP